MAEDITPDKESLGEDAALWHARLEAGTADLDAFNAWRDADPRHAVAFSRILATSNAIDDLRDIELGDDPDLRTGGRNRRQFLRFGGVAAVLIGGASVWGIAQRRASASTGVGERQFVELPDRVRLELNTDTLVEWKRVEGSLRLWLKQGEMVVSVPSGPKPCVLMVGASTVEISGDVNARMRASKLDLTVLRGSCVLKEAGSTKALPVKANQSILAGAGAAQVRDVTRDNIETAMAWQSDGIVFDGETLGVAVEEYNRYLTRKIVIVDPEIAAMRIGGRFSSRDPASFLALAETSFNLRAVTDADGATLLTKQH